MISCIFELFKVIQIWAQSSAINSDRKKLGRINVIRSMQQGPKHNDCYSHIIKWEQTNKFGPCMAVILKGKKTYIVPKLLL